MIRSLLAIAVRAVTDRKGVTAAEYAVLATGIVLVVGLAAGTLGNRLSGVFNTIVP